METNCHLNENGEWISDDGDRVRIFGRGNGTWDVVLITTRNGDVVSRLLIDCGLTHESALRRAIAIELEG